MKKSHKKLLLVALFPIGMSVIIVSILIWSMSSILDSYEAEKDEYRKHMGEKMYIDGDSLTIIDYSTFNETFTLSNGLEVNSSKLITNP